MTDLQANFAQGSCTGTVTFTLPSTTAYGEPLSGDVTYCVMANGAKVAQGTAAAGSNVSEQLTLPSGNTRLRVYASNEAGEGPDATLTLWIGYDVPAAPEDVLLDIDAQGNAIITWDAVTESLNGGYFDASNVVYSIACYMDDVVITTASRSTEAVINLNITERKPCRVGVQALNGGQRSAETLSNNAATGLPLQVPFQEDFDTEQGASLYTVLDSNHDGYTWQWTGETFGTYVYKYNKEQAADDWFITPLVQLQEGVQYRFYFDARPMGSEYPETVSAFYGQGMHTDQYTQLLEATEINGEQLFTLPFTPAATGAYRMAIHVTSPANRLNLVLDYIGVESDGVEAITDVNSEPTSGPVEFYTLDGRRVSAGSATEHGIYIMRQGNKAIKVVK